MILIKKTRNLSRILATALLLAGLTSLAFSSNLQAENATGSQTITGGALNMDYVDGSNVSISSPTLAFSNATFSYTCTPTASGPSVSVNTASRRLQVDNPTANASVAVSMGLTNSADTWTATVAGATYRMDGNDNGSAGGGTTSLTTGGTPFASSEANLAMQIQAASFAFDGISGTSWQSATNAPNMLAMTEGRATPL